MRTLWLVLVMFVSAGCASTRAAVAPDGNPYTLEVFLDRNPAVKNPEQVAQVADYMEPDLHRVLSNAGYTVVPTTNPQAFVPGPGRALVIVRIARYYPGSKAARMFGGRAAMAGMLVLDTEHFVYSGPGQLLFQGRGSVGSSRDWDLAAHKINKQVATEVTRALGGN